MIAFLLGLVPAPWLVVLKKLPWRIIGLAVCAAAVVGSIWWFGHSRYSEGRSAGREEVRKEWEAEKKVVAKALLKRELEVAATIARDKQVAEEIQRELETKLVDAGASGRDLARRLQDYRVRASRCAVPAQGGAAPGPDGATGESSGDEEVGRATEEVFAACRRDAERLVGLQEFVDRTR